GSDFNPKAKTSNYCVAALHAARGNREKALVYLQRTSKIDPASLWVSNFACELYRYFGLKDEAIAAGERSLQLDPTYSYGEPLLAALYREIGRFDEAIGLYQKAQTVTGKLAYGLALTYERLERPRDARKTLETA